MRGVVLLAAVVLSAGARAQCIEEDLVVQHCLTPAEAAYTCQNTGSTDIGLEQVEMCLDASVTTAGLMDDLDRANCIGEQVFSDLAAENVSRCRPKAARQASAN